MVPPRQAQGSDKPQDSGRGRSGAHDEQKLPRRVSYGNRLWSVVRDTAPPVGSGVDTDDGEDTVVPHMVTALQAAQAKGLPPNAARRWLLTIGSRSAKTGPSSQGYICDKLLGQHKIQSYIH